MPITEKIELDKVHYSNKTSFGLNKIVLLSKSVPSGGHYLFSLSEDIVF